MKQKSTKQLSKRVNLRKYKISHVKETPAERKELRDWKKKTSEKKNNKTI